VSFDLFCIDKTTIPVKSELFFQRVYRGSMTANHCLKASSSAQ